MSVSAIGSIAVSTPVQKSQPTAQNARAADGDYLTKGAGRASVQDADGDYKAAPTTAQSTSSPAVQSSVSTLKLGG